jgi:hypothetical protein
MGAKPLNKREGREGMLKIISAIIRTKDEVVSSVSWRSQAALVSAYIKGDDVVLVDADGEFITIMKGGADNERIKSARAQV